MVMGKSHAFAVLVGAVACAAAQDVAEPEYRARVLPVLAKNCFSCHSDKVKTANLSLENPGRSAAIWEKVLDKVSSGRMPPPGSPAPPKPDVAPLKAWMVGQIAAQRPEGQDAVRFARARMRRGPATPQLP